jgi:hypothetical protein
MFRKKTCRLTVTTRAKLLFKGITWWIQSKVQWCSTFYKRAYLRLYILTAANMKITQPFWIYRHVISLKYTDVSEVRTDSIIRAMNLVRKVSKFFCFSLSVSFHTHIGGLVIGPLVDAVQRHSLTPSTWTWSTVNSAGTLREFPASNLDPETGYPDWGLRGIPQSLQANSRIVH